MITINGKNWTFATTHERQIINGRRTNCGVYHDPEPDARILVDASLPIERQLEVAAKAALEIAEMTSPNRRIEP